MPIKLSGDIDTIKKASKQIYNAKFFSKDITGSGKLTGLITQTINPVNIPLTAAPNKHKPDWHITTETNNAIRRTTFPINPLGSYTSKTLDIDPTWCDISDNSATKTYLTITPVSISILESIATVAANQNSTNKITTGKKVSILYRIDTIIADVQNKKGNVVKSEFTENPMYTVQNMSLVATAKANVADYIDKYETYHEICKQSEIWQTTLVDTIIANYDADANNFPMVEIIRYISQYKVTLSQYKILYTELCKRFSQDDIKTYTKMNTSLLLQDTLNDLAQIQFAPLPKPGMTNNQLDLSWCSKEQFDAIVSTAPLNEVQAGAGTGKSTVIKARLDYLNYLGISADDIMVLSFTNAAADNIKERCPNIQSMTIAKMIDTIYQMNHKHQLSSSSAKRGEGSTFTNSLELYKNTNVLVTQLSKAITAVETKNDYATLLKLVEENYNDIINILDTVQQTTFHLEIIICYLEHATLQIPFNIKYLLIDEVQDNAVFEFIFFLNLTRKLKNHLYLVGDCSQTLYEFRASDPKALNAIESSGLFSTFPLNVNYRSNQDILQFANVLLNDIEANQYANIQLQSFALNQITKQSFEKNVIVDYNRLDKISELGAWIKQKLNSQEVSDWIEDKFAKKEQICVLCYKRRDADIFQKEFEKIYPNKKHNNIIPAKTTNFAYFSKYVAHCHQQMFSLPTSSIDDLCKRIRAEIIANLTACNITQTSSIYQIVTTKILTMLAEWQKDNTTMLNDELNKFKQKTITHQKFVETVGESLINYEITKNALRQTLMSQKNADKKENTKDADFIYSTIHSAKGLEYDNVMLLYQNKNQMDEDDKRMYYVGLTRAKKSEYILAYDTVLNAVILSRYENVMQHLPDTTAFIQTTGTAV